MNNSTNNPVNTTVVVTFSLPMDIKSITVSITVTPTNNYTLRWSDQDTTLYIEFVKLLNPDTEYVIRINYGKGKEGGELQNAPFVYKFRTSKESIPKPDPLSIVITSPTTDLIVRTGTEIIISGTSTGYEENSDIVAIIDGRSISGVIGKEGNWSVVVPIPEQAGNYNVTITAGNQSRWLNIIVEEKPDDNGTDEEVGERSSETEDKSGLTTGILLSIIVIIVVFLILYFIIIKKKGSERVKENLDQEESIGKESISIENDSLTSEESAEPFIEWDKDMKN
jgi:hypothetical protein